MAPFFPSRIDSRDPLDARIALHCASPATQRKEMQQADKTVRWWLGERNKNAFGGGKKKKKKTKGGGASDAGASFCH